MTSSTFALTALAAVFLAGCAAADDPNAPPPQERVYRTGSRIPIKDPVPMTPEEQQKAADAAREMLQSASPRPNAKP